jgi:hypothetical protein
MTNSAPVGLIVSVPVQTFVSFCTSLVNERRNQRGTGDYTFPVRLWI